MVLSTDCPSDTIIEVRHTMLNISILFISLFYLIKHSRFNKPYNIKHFLKNKDSAILPYRAILLEHLTQTYLFFHKLKFLT